MDILQHLFFGSSCGPQAELLSSPSPVDILLLGSGWTGSFVVPRAQQEGIKVASTSREGRDGTLRFLFNPEAEEDDPANKTAFAGLPDAQTVLIVFPLYTKKAVANLVRGYLTSRNSGDEKRSDVNPRFILLGSTGIWDNGPTLQLHAPPPYASTLYPSEKKKKPPAPSPPSPSPPHHPDPPPHVPQPSPWIDRHSLYNTSNARAAAEDFLLSLATSAEPVWTHSVSVSVLCLCGLWGHSRSPRRFISALAPTKEALRGLGSVHLVHGRDVAQAVLAMHRRWDAGAQGQRWLLTNQRTYDMWDLASQWGNAGEAGRGHPPAGPQPRWVQELILEHNDLVAAQGEDGQSPPVPPPAPIRALPRTVEQMGKGLDGRDFWQTFDIVPEVPWVD